MATNDELQLTKLFNVKGLVAVVTGGGTGIGLMCAQTLAANGAKVYIASRREHAIENAAKHYTEDQPGEKGNIIPIQADVTSKGSIEKLVEEVSKKEKYINLLINAAGVAGPKASPTHTDGASLKIAKLTIASKLKDTLWNNEDFDGWHSVFETNVAAVYFVTIAFLPLLQNAETFKPSVVNIASMSGITKDSQNHFAYNASKGAATHLVNLMSAEFVDTGIRVNGISPGYFPSEMTSKDESDNRQKSHLGDEYVEGKDVPAGRLGNELDMGSTILYLASRGGEYLNGHVIVLDGGWLLKH